MVSGRQEFYRATKIYLDSLYIVIYIGRRCNIDTETVQTVVSRTPRTWRIAVTGGATTANMDTASAVAVAVGFLTMANFAFSPLR